MINSIRKTVASNGERGGSDLFLAWSRLHQLLFCPCIAAGNALPRGSRRVSKLPISFCAGDEGPKWTERTEDCR
jgi:hypothetical protein